VNKVQSPFFSLFLNNMNSKIILFIVITWLTSLTICMIPLYSGIQQASYTIFFAVIPLGVLFALLYSILTKQTLRLSDDKHVVSIIVMIVIPALYPTIGLSFIGYAIGGKSISTLGFFIGAILGIRIGVFMYLTPDVGSIIAGNNNNNTTKITTKTTTKTIDTHNGSGIETHGTKRKKSTKLPINETKHNKHSERTNQPRIDS
jgi:hypothetical protein